MNKHEIYEALKADGAKLPKAERFMSADDLKAIYTERFGHFPEEQPVLHAEPAKCDRPAEVKQHLLRFIESGWCPALGRSYTRGLYRPKTPAEYEALKPFAAEEVL